MGHCFKQFGGENLSGFAIARSRSAWVAVFGLLEPLPPPEEPLPPPVERLIPLGKRLFWHVCCAINASSCLGIFL